MNDVVLAIITALKANTATAALVSTRVHRATLPALPTFPAVVVSEVSDIQDDDTSTSGYAHTRIQCTCYASTDTVSSALSKTVRAALHRTTITVPASGTTNGVYLASIFDAGHIPDVNTSIPAYLYHRDFMIEYN